MKMKIFVLICFLVTILTGCGFMTLSENHNQSENIINDSVDTLNENQSENKNKDTLSVSDETNHVEDIPVKQNVFYITAGDTVLTANFADSTAADSLKELLRSGDIAVSMNDYGGWEKVGSLGQTLNRNDTQITASVGDVMLYQGSQIVIFYGNNSWSYSRLGKIENVSKDDLLSAFGTGDTEITLSLTK